MSIHEFDKAKRLLICIGEIADSFLEEVESADIVPSKTTRKRVVQYSALAAVASVSIAATYFLIRSKRASAAANIVNISVESA